MNCNICNAEAKINRSAPDRRLVYDVECPRCGAFLITHQAYDNMVNFPAERRIIFSGYLRNHSTWENPITIEWKEKDIEETISVYENYPTLEKINKLIKFIGEKSNFIGDYIEFDNQNDFTLFYCKNAEELSYLLMYLSGLSIIFPLRTTPKPNGCACSLTIDGWQKYEKLKTTIQNTRRVFIAMSFDKSLDDIFESGIKKACHECGFEAYRVDREEHNDKICDKIIAEIRQSRFLIADFTGQKQGVYFEAGFAYGLGLPVIWCCQKDEIDDKKIHFDTRQYNHISWENIDDLKIKLINRIRATIIKSIANT